MPCQGTGVIMRRLHRAARGQAGCLWLWGMQTLRTRHAPEHTADMSR